MSEQTSQPILDYQPYVDDRVRGFTGREWAFARIDRWLGGEGPRFFLLTGEPGSGKSALASRLFQISRGQSPAGDGMAHLKTDFLSAAHFCSARAQSWITPHTFTESLSLQLARYPVFARSLLEHAGDRQVRIVVRQEVGHAEGGVAGVVIERLDLSGIAPEDGFVRAVREPLEALLDQERDLRICILVDGLDEALLYSGRVGIVSLISRTADLPKRVRFLLTSRPDDRVENAFREAEALYMSGEEFTAQNREDVRRYVTGRLKSDAKLAPAVAPLDAAAIDSVTDGVTGRAGGNFQYARFFLDAVAGGLRKLLDFEGLPAGLNGLYSDSLQRVVRPGAADWTTAYAPLMGVLSVAQESLSLAQLQSLSGQADADFWKHLSDLRQFIEVVRPDPGGDARYRLYHQSLTDFLRLAVLRVDGKELNNSFYLPPRAWHERIGDYFLSQYAGYWSDCVDLYGFRFVATHLAEAARTGDRLMRHRRIAQLAGLVTDLEFQAAHQKYLDDLPALQRDLERALRSVATDHHPEAVPLAVETAMSLTAARRRYLRPEELFELARAGKLPAAERRLALYGPELEWRQAILLLLAWLAVPTDRAAAQDLCDRVMAEGVAPPLDLLAARLDADLTGVPAALPPLPPPPDLPFVTAILDRIGGGGENVTGIEPLALQAQTVEAIHMDADSVPAYLAEMDGPPLVAFAALDPVQNTRFLRDYISIHAANHYLHYRNRSLWALVAPVLLHPDPTWSREMLVELAQAALTDTRIDFREGLSLALQALHDKAGNPGATPFRPQVEQAEEEADAILTGNRGGGDPWGHVLRRLAVLAEIHALALSDRPRAAELFGRARALPFGFAGFRAPACMALAEAASICLPESPGAVTDALDQALRAAHNVQDYVLCARATSRVNAVMLRWWKTPPDRLAIVAAVERLIAAPGGAECAAVHTIGETYPFRVDTPHRLRIPDWARHAASLDDLVRLYQRARTLVMQLNPETGCDVASPLPAGKVVDVPDPEFTPLLAARLAAEALTSPSLPARGRVELIQLLVPLAVANPTALDLVLTRLVLAALPSDPATLERLCGSVQRHVEDPQESPKWEIPLPPPGVPT
jgi:hypothetical protein